MKKILIMFLLIIPLTLTFSSCDKKDNSNGDNLPDIGVDISKYDKPQTEFLKDGHKLSKLEEIMKLVIDEGKFVYEPNLNAIGYKLLLADEDKIETYLFYFLNEIRVIRLDKTSRYHKFNYVKLLDSLDNFNMVYKIFYNSRYYDDLYLILEASKKTFTTGVSTNTVLLRGHYKENKDEMIINTVKLSDNMLKLVNSKIKEKLNFSLKEIGYDNF